MYPFVLVMTFLLLFSFFTTSEMKRHVTSVYREKGFSTYIKNKEFFQKQKQKALLQQFKSAIHNKNPEDLGFDSTPKPPKKESSSTKKRCYKLNFDLSRPPDNARLNLRPFLVNPKKKIGNKLCIEIFENLILDLYKDAPFFQQIPLFEKRITEALLRERDKLIHAEFGDEIGILIFEEPEMRDAFYKMLKGDGEFPSLLNYIALDPHTKSKINLIFAAPELIRVLLEHKLAAERVISYRDQVVAQMCLADTTFTRTQITNDLKKQIDLIVTEENLPQHCKQFFDYQLGNPGRLIFFKDPISGKLRYNKILLAKSQPEAPINHEPIEEKHD